MVPFSGLQIFRADAEPPCRRRKKKAARLARLLPGWRFRFARPIGCRRCTARPAPVRYRRRSMRIFSSSTSSSSAAIWARRREDPLTKLGLAGENRHRVVRVQSNPPLQSSVVAQTERQRSRRLAHAGRGRQANEATTMPSDCVKRLRERPVCVISRAPLQHAELRVQPDCGRRTDTADPPGRS